MANRYLMIRDVSGQVQVLPVDGGRDYRIGRSESADVRLDHEHVSRLHARLSFGPEQSWWIQDLDSRNGTWLEGKAIDHPAPLYNQQVVQLGPFDLWLQSTPDPSQELPANHTIDRLVTAVYDEAESTIRPASQAMAGIDLRVLERLHALSLSLAETLSVASRMDTVCAFVREQSPLVQLCAVLGLKSDDPDTVHILHASTDQAGGQPYISRTLLKRVQREQRPMFMSTLSSASTEQPMLSIVEQQHQATLAAFACPMLERPGGPLLYVLFAAESCDPYWQSLLQLVVSHYRHADTLQRLVDQARIDRELKHARTIQLGLVPTQLDALPLDVAIGFKPCHEVGGDYADAVVLPDGRVLIALADVTGKGMPAAMLSSSVHTLVHTVADAGGSLVDIAQRLNRYLMRFAPTGAFVTGVLLFIEPATGDMQVINAGHMPPLIASSRGVSNIDHVRYMPFGIDEQDFEITHTVLKPDERVVLYSDGLSELSTPTGDMPGIEGVQQALTSHTQGPAQDTAKGMEAWVKQMAGDTAPSDDQTLVIAQLRAHP